MDSLSYRWTGGNTTVVQVGDLLDRGNSELAVLDLFECVPCRRRRPPRHVCATRA